MANGIVGPVVGTVKLLALLLVLLLWFPLAMLADALGSRAVLRGIDCLFGRVALVLLSFWWLEPRGPKRMLLRSALQGVSFDHGGFTLHSDRVSTDGAHRGDTIEPGDWIISNHCSYIDLIYYWYLCSPVCTRIDSTSPHRVTICRNRFSVLFFQDVWRAGSATSSAVSNTMSSAITCPTSPLLIFPEGTTTNGRGVLAFVADLSTATRNQRIHLTALKYAALPRNPSHVAGSQLLHMWHMCSQLTNWMTARTITPAALFSSNFVLPAATSPLYNRTLQQIIAALGHLRPLTLQMTDKQRFLQKYLATEGSYK